MRNEDTQSFIWLLNHVKSLYKEARLSFPRVLITDADAALRKAIPHVFPNSHHFLCLWHVNKAIQAWSKAIYRSHQIQGTTREEQDENADRINEKWGEILREWQKIVSTKTEIDYRLAWEAFRMKYKLEDGLVTYIWIYVA